MVSYHFSMSCGVHYTSKECFIAVYANELSYTAHTASMVFLQIIKEKKQHIMHHCGAPTRPAVHSTPLLHLQNHNLHFSSLCWQKLVEKLDLEVLTWYPRTYTSIAHPPDPWSSKSSFLPLEHDRWEDEKRKYAAQPAASLCQAGPRSRALHRSYGAGVRYVATTSFRIWKGSHYHVGRTRSKGNRPFSYGWKWPPLQFSYLLLWGPHCCTY